jgi:hypothetical protein
VLQTLHDGGVDFLIGGGYAMEILTSLRRRTKDLDLYVVSTDMDTVLQLLRTEGYRTEVKDPCWLAKIHDGEEFVDVIFNHNNRCCPVDGQWMVYSRPISVLDIPCRLCPPEELIWHKAFIMARERYDGADVAHLLETLADQLDWQRLVARFAQHWRVLYSHLILFGFIYPASRGRIPTWVMQEMAQRLEVETAAPPVSEVPICAGTLLSVEDFRADVEQRAYINARPSSTLSPSSDSR